MIDHELLLIINQMYKYIISNMEIWRVGGNANPFNSSLENWMNKKSDISQRSIGVLQYIFHYKNNEVEKKTFELEIKNYLNERFFHGFNKSIDGHFYRALEFVGLIRNIDDELSLSIDGRNFLNLVEENSYEKALEFYILQLLKVKYPNTATNKNKKLNLFPFRIIFKVILKYQNIPKDWFTYKIPYINTLDDFEKIEKINKDKIFTNVAEKWESWVLSYLKKFNILEENKSNKLISISEKYKKFISDNIEDMKDSDLFFNEDNIIEKLYISKKSIKRDSKLIKEVIKEEEYKCFINSEHFSFKAKSSGYNYVEGHHIIPISLQGSFINENLDCKDNIIPLCPNCHKAMHHAVEEERKRYIETILNKNSKLKSFYNLTIDDLKEIYDIHI